jgi:hypothetical protein
MDCWDVFSRFIYRILQTRGRTNCDDEVDDPMKSFEDIPVNDESRHSAEEAKLDESEGDDCEVFDSSECSKARFELLSTTNHLRIPSLGGPILLDGRIDEEDLIVRCSLCQSTLSVRMVNMHSLRCWEGAYRSASSQERNSLELCPNLYCQICKQNIPIKEVNEHSEICLLSHSAVSIFICVFIS